MEALRKKERQDETPVFLSFIPCWMLMYFFAGLSLILNLCMTKLRVLVLSFSHFMDNSIILIRRDILRNWYMRDLFGIYYRTVPLTIPKAISIVWLSLDTFRDNSKHKNISHFHFQA
jgi:hypothetical protein